MKDILILLLFSLLGNIQSNTFRAELMLPNGDSKPVLIALESDMQSNTMQEEYAKKDEVLKAVDTELVWVELYIFDHRFSLSEFIHMKLFRSNNSNYLMKDNEMCLFAAGRGRSIDFSILVDKSDFSHWIIDSEKVSFSRTVEFRGDTFINATVTDDFKITLEIPLLDIPAGTYKFTDIVQTAEGTSVKIFFGFGLVSLIQSILYIGMISEDTGKVKSFISIFFSGVLCLVVSFDYRRVGYNYFGVICMLLPALTAIFGSLYSITVNLHLSNFFSLTRSSTLTPVSAHFLAHLLLPVLLLSLVLLHSFSPLSSFLYPFLPTLVPLLSVFSSGVVVGEGSLRVGSIERSPSCSYLLCSLLSSLMLICSFQFLHTMPLSTNKVPCSWGVGAAVTITTVCFAGVELSKFTRLCNTDAGPRLARNRQTGTRVDEAILGRAHDERSLEIEIVEMKFGN